MKQYNLGYTNWAQKCYDSAKGWTNTQYCDGGCNGLTGQCNLNTEIAEANPITLIVNPIYSNKETLEVPHPVILGDCNGCLVNEKCLPYETRVKGNYCDISGKLDAQKPLGDYCEDNYQCLSNDCKDGKCISTAGLLQRILDYLSKIFG